MQKWLIATGITVALAGAAWAKDKKPPYWASISSSEAMMRTGPGKNYPATWLYKRSDLPIRVVDTQPSWRKVQDPDGTTGWMLVGLLSDQRTGIVSPGAPRMLHAEASETSAVSYRAAPGVVGRVSKCDGSWCRFEAKGKGGFIRQADIWGVSPGETLD